MDPEPRRTTPTRLGYFLLSAMDKAGYTKVAPFARAAKVSPSTMHRVIYGESGRPDVDTLLQIAHALAGGIPPDGAPEAERVAHQQVAEPIYRELLAEAGYSITPVASTHSYDPVALKVDDAIGMRSTLPEVDRLLLRTMVERLVDDAMRRHRKRAG